MPDGPDPSDAPGTTRLPDDGGARRQEELVAGLLFVGLLAVVLARNAWLSDDAYITFRTVLNFADGYTG